MKPNDSDQINSASQLPASTISTQPPTPKKASKVIWMSFGILIIFILLISTWIVSTSKPSSSTAQNTPSPSLLPSPTASPTVEAKITKGYGFSFKASPTDKNKTDIFFMNEKTNEESLYLTLTDVYRNHYHNPEYHNGNLYIITRTGGDSGYENAPDWTDTLWRYNSQKQAQKLYSAKGLDFRVSDDEKYICITTNEKLTLLDQQGDPLKTFNPTEFSTTAAKYSPEIGILSWTKDSLWLEKTVTVSLTGLVKIDLNTFKATSYDFDDSFGPEYDLNPTRGLLAFSDYPPLFDVDTADEYHQSGSKVHLYTFNIYTKTKQQISTSITKKFNPKWTSDNKLEYDNPKGTGRLSKTF